MTSLGEKTEGSFEVLQKGQGKQASSDPIKSADEEDTPGETENNSDEDDTADEDVEEEIID